MLDGDKGCGEQWRRGMGRLGRGEEGRLHRAARRVSLRKEHLSKHQEAETRTDVSGAWPRVRNEEARCGCSSKQAAADRSERELGP